MTHPTQASSTRILVWAGLLTFALIPAITQAEDAPEIEILETWPTCEYERLGPVEARDGKEVTTGSISRKANIDRARSRLIKQAKKLKATRIVLTQRRVQRDGDTVRFVHLKGTAIGHCLDG